MTKNKPRSPSRAGLVSVKAVLLLRRGPRNHQDAGAGAEVLFGGGVDLVDGDGVVDGVAALGEVYGTTSTKHVA